MKATIWKNVLRVILAILLFLVFCPTFLVSCSGQKIEVGVMDAVFGLRANGELVTEQHPIMLLCLFIPIILLVVLGLKKLAEKVAAIAVLGAAVLDFILWLSFKSGAEKEAAKNYCGFEVKGTYYLNLFLILALVVIAVLALIGMIHLVKDAAAATGSAAIAGAAQKSIPTRAAAPAAAPKAGQAKFCPQCGAKLEGAVTFCGSCGTKIE